MQTKKDNNQLDILIQLAVNKYGIENILKSFFDVSGWKEKDKAIEWLSSNQTDELTEQMQFEQSMFILKISNLDKREKLADFINSEIFPCYNEQQTFFN